MRPHASIIIPTYNQPRYLELVLGALCRQTVNNFEVIIGDDGSTSETSEFVASLQRKKLPYQLKYYWHPDEGFRAPEVRNGAIELAAADWLIFIDGDMVVHPRFVETHLHNAGAHHVLFGGRVKLNEEFSKSLSLEDVLGEGIENIYQRCFAHCREKIYSPVRQNLGDLISNHYIQYIGGNRCQPLDRMINTLNRLMSRKVAHRICFKTGSNFSVSRALVHQVNGFDTHFNNLSGEDSELFWRLLHAGAKPRSVLFSAIAYHLWHKDNWQRVGEQRQQAVEMQKQTKVLRKVRCENGLRNYGQS